MKVEEIVKDAASTDVLIQGLKDLRPNKEPNTDEFRKEYEPECHKVMDRHDRPDKDVINNEGEKRIEKVARVALALQKLIVKRMASFTFGNPVKNNCETENDQEEAVLKALERILYDTKATSLNKRMAREIGKSTEVAECWFPVKAPDGFSSYGFPSRSKMRCHLFRPSEGDKLYPAFDETGDMIAFSREFKRKEGPRKDLEVTYFETYTDEEKRVWRQEGGGEWTELKRETITIGKIPIVYGRQGEVEWADVQALIERLEKLLSNFADTNDYHASPKIFVEGKIVGWSKKGEAGAILEGEKGSKAEYLSWEHAPESVKLEIETLLRMIYGLTQTPDISFDSIKGLGDISGIALKLLFMDAHLKVKDKEEIFIEYLQRRYSIIKSYIGEMNTSLRKAANALEIEPEIVPYMIDDERTLVETLLAGTGGKAVVSQKKAVRVLGWADDPEEEYAQLQEETVGGLEE